MYEFIKENQLTLMLVLCGVCAMAAFLLTITRFLSKSRKLSLINMELIAFFLLWFDRLAYVYSGDVSRKAYIMVRVSNCMVFFLTSAIVAGFNSYLTDWLVHEGNMEVLPKRLTFVKYTSIVGMTLSIISAFTGLYYFFDEMNVYHRGDGFLIAYIIPVVCPIIQLTVIWQNRERIRKLIFISMVLYVVVPLVCGITQIFVYGISIVNMSMVMVSVCLYIFTYIDINETVENAHEIEIRTMQGERKRMQKLFDQTATAFISAVEEKDELIKGCSVQIAEYARQIAEQSGKSEAECEEIYYAALLHDVGLAGIPDELLPKDTDPDSSSEVVQRIPKIGREILSRISEYPYLSEAAYYCHEKYDGTGYPEGLKGEEIPEAARIIAVAHTYVDMTTRKRFREAEPDYVVIEALVKGSGEAYDPNFAETMIKIIQEKSNREMQQEDRPIETEISCKNYKEHVTNGIPITREVTRVTFRATSVIHEDSIDFWAPSVILFDSYDRQVHDTVRAIQNYRYMEYAECWFDNHSIQTAARRIKETITPRSINPGEDASAYEIVMGRFEDHLRLRMISPEYEKEAIIVLPNRSQNSYLSLTGENCELTGITVEKTGETVGPTDIPKIAEENTTYIDRFEADIRNIQVDRPRSAYTEGVQCTDRLRLTFHSKTLPSGNLLWHCPYLILFSSDDGKVFGKNYREYGEIRLYGENEGDSEYAHNSITVRKTEEFPGWDIWKEKNKAGLEYSVILRKKNDRLILKSRTLGIDLENTTIFKETRGKVYVALTGDQVALTDIRIKY